MVDLTPQEAEKLAALRQKFALAGQDMVSYLEGLLHARYLTYWDYLHIDTLLSLQTPRTDFPDEHIFICYHQITELYFKLILLELDQLCALQAPTPPELNLRLGRVNAYFKNLTQSFDVMVGGMAPQQFLQFRMALLPASGFQSAQFREIEFRLTGLAQLLHAEADATVKQSTDLAAQYPHLYWKSGNLELKSGQKTLTLQMFEQRYDAQFMASVRAHTHNNMRQQWLGLDAAAQVQLRDQLRALDLNANVFWRLSHYKSAVKYLQKDPEDIRATGGTNWQKYLPPRFQKVIYYPEVWSADELAEWGKGWVLELFKEKVEGQWSGG